MVGRAGTAREGACEAAGVACHRYGGFLLHEPETIRNGSGEPYQASIRPSRRPALRRESRRPRSPCPPSRHGTARCAATALEGLAPAAHEARLGKGLPASGRPARRGAQRGSMLHRRWPATLRRERDRPDRECTSRLSPHLHFGEISPAQCWHACARQSMAAAAGRSTDGEKFLKEVLWREFSYHLLHHLPTLARRSPSGRSSGFPVERRPARCWRPGSGAAPAIRSSMPACASCGPPAPCTTACA